MARAGLRRCDRQQDRCGICFARMARASRCDGARRMHERRCGDGRRGSAVLSTLRRLRACAMPRRDRRCVLGLTVVAVQHVRRQPAVFCVTRARRAHLATPSPSARGSFGRGCRAQARDPRARGRALARCRRGRSPRISCLAWLRNIDAATFLDNAEALDAVIEARRVEAASEGRALRHVASLDANGRARVGLAAVDASHPRRAWCGTDNLFALTTERYRARPLVIRGRARAPR